MLDILTGEVGLRLSMGLIDVRLARRLWRYENNRVPCSFVRDETLALSY